MLRQGICDPSQARRVGDRGEAVADLGECYPRRLGLAGHVLVAIEDDLRAERRVPRHLDRDVSPHRIHDVERVVVDVFDPLSRLTMAPVVRERCTFHTGAGALTASTKSTPVPTRWVARYSSAMRCLRSPALQKITGTPFAAPHALTRHPNGSARRCRGWVYRARGL